MAIANGTVEEEIPLDFKLELAQKSFEYRTQDVPHIDRSALKTEILDLIFQHDMAPVYEEICQEWRWDIDMDALERMRKANASRLEELEAKIRDAEENAGEMEVRDALAAKAYYLADVGNYSAACQAFETVKEKTAGAGPKLDLAFALLRLEISRGDWIAVKKQLEKATELCASGGDWERKNRLKVYEAIFLMASRQFKRAAELFLDSIATFTATELMSYKRCVFYTVVLAVAALGRSTLKSRVIDSPEVLSIIDQIPHLHTFADALYSCQYADWMKSFAELTDAVRSDRYLYPHFRYYMKEVCQVAFSQFLESYRSVTLDAMSSTFGISPEFLDMELAKLIANGRLPAKIDRVAGIVETTRPDAKNALYQSAIRQGDFLLNKIQKLGKVVDIE